MADISVSRDSIAVLDGDVQHAQPTFETSRAKQSAGAARGARSFRTWLVTGLLVVLLVGALGVASVAERHKHHGGGGGGGVAAVASGEAYTPPTAPLVEPASEDESIAECKAEAAARGLMIAGPTATGNQKPFSSDWKGFACGCFEATAGVFKGKAYYGTGCDDADNSDPSPNAQNNKGPFKNKVARIDLCDQAPCVAPPAPAPPPAPIPADCAGSWDPPGNCEITSPTCSNDASLAAPVASQMTTFTVTQAPIGDGAAPCVVDPPAAVRTTNKLWHGLNNNPNNPKELYDADDAGSTSSSFAILTPCSGCATPHKDGHVDTGYGTNLDPCETPDTCPTSDCAVTWSDWGGCSAECGPGTQDRSSTVDVAPVGPGAPCPAAIETQDCNDTPCPVDCVGGYKLWSPCSADCGGGDQTSAFIATTAAANGGAACPPEKTQTCNENPCPVDCAGDYVPEDAACDGSQISSFVVSQEAAYGGMACPASTKTEQVALPVGGTCGTCSGTCQADGTCADCNSHGSCSDGECTCTDHFSGPSCTACSMAGPLPRIGPDCACPYTTAIYIRYHC